MDLTAYERIINGSTKSESDINNSVEIYNSEFSEYPFYREILIDGVDGECIFKTTKKSTEMKLYFRPYTSITKGMYILLEGDMYMVTEFVSNGIYPKAEIELCNNTLRWRDTLGTLHEYDCIISGSGYEFDEPTRQNHKIIMQMSKSELNIMVKYDENTKAISPKTRFIFGGYAYDVLEIDSMTNVYKEQGFITLGVTATELTDTDDTNTGIADDSGNSGWGDW